nr:neogenin-like isoform X1 [Pocillopora verrucosa]
MLVNDSHGVQEHSSIPQSYRGRVKIEGRATLVIKNINPADNTKFKCELERGLRTFRSVVQLIVAEAPLINLSLGGKYYIEGSPVTIACEASGKPLPDVAWIRNGVLESSGKKASFLKFDNINRTDAGQYTCRANNSVEVTFVDTTIVVHYPPTIQNVTTSSKKSWIGQTVTLKCLSDGVPTPTLSWYKPEGSEINRVTARENKVQVPLRGDQDFGHYKCIAANGLTPPDEELIKINPIKKPGKASIKSSESVIQATFITIRWTAPADDGGSPITGYQLILQKGETELEKDAITNPGTTSYSFRGLEKNTNYTVKLFSRNFVFEGDPTVRTIKTKLEGAPDVVEIDQLPDETTDDTITLKWKEPESNGKVITMYTVYQRVVTDGKVGQWTEIRKIRDVSTKEFKIALEKGKVYQFAITATNELGESLKQEKANIQQVKAEVQTVSTEVYLTATIEEDCSKRSEVAAKFPEMACQIAFRFGCSSANTVNTRCGSVVLDFMMRFNQTVVVSNVLIVLSDAARQDKFRGFKVNPDSIKQVLIPTDGSESTTKGPEECNCPSNNVLLAVIGVLAFTVLLLIIYIIWLHKKGAVGKQRTYEDERRVCDNETLLEDIEPSLPDSRKLTQPHAEYMDLIEVNKDDRKAQSTPPGADYVPLHPLTRCWEVPRHNVTIEKIIGKGAFGQVAKGTAVGLRGSPETTTVAIKMLKTNATESDKRDLMKELDTMKQLKPHPYVIKLLGCVTESEQLLVLIEYVPFGDLLGYLRKSRGLKDTYYKDPDIKPQTNLTSQQLMKFAWQIADGMSYLSAKS